MISAKSSVNDSLNDTFHMELFLSHVDKAAGLNQEQVENSRKMFGANYLTPPIRTPLWLQFLEKFKDPTIILLSCAAIVSILIGMYV